MKAIVRDRYGPLEALAFEDIERPTPGPGEVLVRVEAAGVNPADWMLTIGRPRYGCIGNGVVRPASPVPGRVLTGVVEAVGPDTDRFTPGDAVFGQWSAGAYAEYAVGAADRLAIRPPGVSAEAAVTLPLAGVTALQGLRDAGRLAPGAKVLVNGAAGGIGTIAVQVAKALGAAEVTGVCAPDAVALLRSIGVDHVVDYTAEDFTETGDQYDLLFDLVGNRPIRSCLQVVADGGVYVPSGGPHLGWLARSMAMSLVRRGRVAMLVERENTDDLDLLAGLVVAGDLTPVIDRRFTLGEVPEALSHQGAGHARGKTIITIA